MQVFINIDAETSSWTEQNKQDLWELIEGHTQLGDLAILNIEVRTLKEGKDVLQP